MQKKVAILHTIETLIRVRDVYQKNTDVRGHDKPEYINYVNTLDEKIMELVNIL